jgi:hypothetical protein
LNDEKDKRSLYKSYIAYITDSTSLLDPQAQINAPVMKRAPVFSEYFENGYKIVIDIRASKGYVNQSEAIEKKHDKLYIEISLKEPVPSDPYVLSVYGITNGEYVKIKDKGDTIITFTQYVDASRTN